MGRGHTKKGLTRGRSMGERPTQSRERGQGGNSPLRGQGAELPCGVWGNAPTVPRVTSMLNALNKGAGSEASLPVTLRIRRCAPSLLHPPLAHCRAKWARPSISHFLFYNATFEMQGFRHCGGDAEFSSRPPTLSACAPMFLVFSCCLLFLAAGGFSPLDAVGHRCSRCCRRNPASARFQAHPR